MIKTLMAKEKKEELFVLLMCVYGYSMYAHFAALAVGNNYYMRCLPYVFVLFYWIKQGINYLPNYWQSRVSLAVLLMCAFALFTNHNYVAHPNIFNLSRNPMVDPLVAAPLPDGRPYFFHQVAGINESFLRPFNSLGQKDQGFVFEYQFPDHETLKRYYRQESDFSREGNFIASLTTEDQKVPLICSFDLRILQAAKRKPFFYAVPIFGARPLKARSFADTALYHKDFLNREIQRIKDQKPPIIFVQGMYWDETIPYEYHVATNTEGLMHLLAYIRKYYQPFKQDGHLIALKRIHD
jgi:hypothetical protein